jgi:hypothetical protein
MKVRPHIAIGLLALVFTGCGDTADKDNDKPSAVESTVRTITQHDTIQAGRATRDRLNAISADREADRHEVGID